MRDVRGFDPAASWTLNDHVSLRDEEFGALAYHHVTRRLVFLKTRRLVEVVRHLREYASASEAVTELVPESERPSYLAALSSLATSDVVTRG